MAVHSKAIATTNNFIGHEIPSGDIDGVNAIFELSNTPIANSEIVRLSGLVQVPGFSKDYMISDAIITFYKAPKVGQEVVVSYFI